MPSIQVVKRLVKRIILSNLATDKNDLFLTPLISGKHGIGKSQIIKSIAKEIDGICYTIEGGTLKEGEIAGIPYQFKDEKNQLHFRFLPYYVIEKIQKQEQIYNENDNSNTLKFSDKIQKIKNKKIKPVIVFIDEINRTDNAVYKELMNILLTREVNGYKLPWWVFFVAAMNPSNDYSNYQTNEMDPAQLDRFFKIVARENITEWLDYAKNTKIDHSLVEFIRCNGEVLSEKNEELEDQEEGNPSPRGWDMIDTIIKAKKHINVFFTKEEINKETSDIRLLIEAKVGKKIAMLYYTFLSQVNIYTLSDFLADNIDLFNFKSIKSKLTTSSYAVLINELVDYLCDDDNLSNQKYYEKMCTKINKLLKEIDKSTALLFIQITLNTKNKDNNLVFSVIKDVFDEELLTFLSLTMDSIYELKVR